MNPWFILLLMAAYFGLLVGVGWLTSKTDDNASFFLGKRNSPWYAVAFGMIGASLSGVTFISVPGWVGSSQFAYMQMVLGYFLGYLVIAFGLLPVYYKLQLTSIYGYLQYRLGPSAHKTGAWFFLLSRMVGSSFRLYLVAVVLQWWVFDSLQIPFWITVVITIALIWLYTYKSGIKTIVWTDSLQTVFMLLSLVITLFWLGKTVIPESQNLIDYFNNHPNSKIFVFDSWRNPRFFFRQFLSGALITIVMTGLDQDMMQKNLSCRNLRDAQKNMLWFAFVLIGVNLLFLGLGLLLTDVAQAQNLQATGDKLFPTWVMQSAEPILILLFFVGLIAAAYSSADSALTALTTSFYIDILGQNTENKSLRKQIHLGISAVMAALVIGFRYLVDEHVIENIFRAAGFTYGPLLGMFAFGLLSKRQLKSNVALPVIAVLSPVVSWMIDEYLQKTHGISLNFEVLALNGLLTFTGLYLYSQKPKQTAQLSSL